jgi:hypothetical protein
MSEMGPLFHPITLDLKDQRNATVLYVFGL